jgi:hypothetical protein
MEELREQLLASDPIQLRRRATQVLGKILAQRLDPRYRRTAMDVLNYLDQQEQAVSSAGWEAYRAAAAQIAALDAVETSRKKRGHSPSARPAAKALQRERETEGSDESMSIQPTPEVPEDAERREAEIRQVVADRQRMRLGEAPLFQKSSDKDSQLDDPTPLREEAAAGVVQWERKPGHFGKGGWTRQSSVH